MKQVCVYCAMPRVVFEWKKKLEGGAPSPPPPIPPRREHRGADSVEDCRRGPSELQRRPVRGVASRRRGLMPPEGTGGKGPLRTCVCITWHGSP